jgi:hypothetical protein
MSAYCHLAELVGGGRYTVEIEDRFSDFWQGPEVGKEQLIQWLLEPATVEMMDTALEITPTEFVQMLSEARERLIRWQQCDARPRSTP